MKIRGSYGTQVVDFEVPLGDSLDEAVTLYGAAKVYHLVKMRVSTLAKNSARDMLRKHIKPEEVKRRMETEWTPIARLKRTVVVDTSDIDAADIEAILGCIEEGETDASDTP